MTCSFVQIIADDLTGALDAAAPFARVAAPVRLLINDPSTTDVSGLAGLTVSSESRDLTGLVAKTAVERAFERLVKAGCPTDVRVLRFAKVDSVLRGRPIEETMLRMRLWQADTCVFIPAFPAMGRRTRAGRHEVRVKVGWQPAAVDDLVAAFRAAGAAVRHRGAEDMHRDYAPGIVVGDVGEERHLDGHVRAFAADTGVVWAGSRGLAEALAGTTEAAPMPAISTVVVGTSHAVTREQIAAAHAVELFSKRVLIDPVPECVDAEKTRARIAAAIDALDASTISGIVVIGGDTLTIVLAHMNAVCLDCIGEIEPGIPLSLIKGGRFDGVPIVTKSGGFGGKDWLVRTLSDRRVR